MRWRLAEVPFGLDYPYWVDDPDFDLDFHVRELALPPPGTDEKLAEQVARIVARPLDRARPLWELYLIHGLEHGYVAMLTKIHHAAIDGLSGAEIMGVLFDLAPAGPRAAERRVLGRRRSAERARDARPRAARAAALSAADPALAARRAAEPRRDRRSARVPGAETRRPGRRARAPHRPRPARGRRARARQPARRREPRSTAASRRTGASSSASSRSTRSRRSRTTTAARSTTSSSRSAPAPCAAGWSSHGELPADPLVAQIPVSVRSERSRAPTATGSC